MAPESTAADAGQDTRRFGIPPDRGALTFINRDPPRIVKTEGFERLFSHYTGLHGEELLQYLQEFQVKALKVSSFSSIVNVDLSLCVYFERRIRRFEGTSPLRIPASP
jgi:hypothetical protein